MASQGGATSHCSRLAGAPAPKRLSSSVLQKKIDVGIRTTNETAPGRGAVVKRWVLVCVLCPLVGLFLGLLIISVYWIARDLTEYSLNEYTFDAGAMAKIERESGIDLPDDAQGLSFHHIPPIDPIVFAKIEIPAETEELMKERIGALDGYSFPEDFANDSCEWWPAAPENVVLSKQAFSNGHYVQLHLVKEKERLILYIKYFTI